MVYYIRDNVTGHVLLGIGSISRRYRAVTFAWRSWRDKEWARRFPSIEKAKEFISKYGMVGVSIIDDTGKVVYEKDQTKPTQL